MTRKLWLLLAVVLSCGLIAAGCGDDDDGGGSDEPAQEESGGGAGDTGGGGDSGGGGGDATPDTSDEAVEEAKRQCKQAIETSPQANEDLKDEFLELCDELESPEDVTRISREICEKSVEQSAPAGPVRDQALQACESVGKTP